jgi:hypothetical protein
VGLSSMYLVFNPSINVHDFSRNTGIWFVNDERGLLLCTASKGKPVNSIVLDGLELTIEGCLEVPPLSSLFYSFIHSFTLHCLTFSSMNRVIALGTQGSFVSSVATPSMNVNWKYAASFINCNK